MSDKALLIASNLVVIFLAVAIMASVAWIGDASIVALSRDNQSVTNSGNVDAIIESDGMSGMAVLGVRESINAGGDDNVRAEQA